MKANIRLLTVTSAGGSSPDLIRSYTRMQVEPFIKSGYIMAGVINRGLWEKLAAAALDMHKQLPREDEQQNDFVVTRAAK